jgi:hypothetical protein
MNQNDETTWQSADLPRSSIVKTIPFDKRSIDAVAESLGVDSAVAPFRLPSGAVYQLLIPDTEHRPSVMVTLWPSIHRVDAVSTAATVVFTDVQTIDIVGEIEVQFRRSNRDYLIVARGGKVIVRA